MPRLQLWMLVVVVTLAPVVRDSRSAWAQTAPELDNLRFEVASVKPNNSGSQNSNIELHPGGRITATNVVLAGLMRNVFNLQPYQLVNAPDWIETARFDIEAKADREYSAREDAPAPELLAMLRSLRADRFQLVTHRETRDMPAYAVVVARSDGALGPRMRRSTVDCEAEATRAADSRLICLLLSFSPVDRR